MAFSQGFANGLASTDRTEQLMQARQQRDQQQQKVVEQKVTSASKRLEDAWVNINNIIESSAGVVPPEQMAVAVRVFLDEAMENEFLIDSAHGIEVNQEELINANLSKVQALSRAAKMKRESEIQKTRETETVKQDVKSKFAQPSSTKAVLDTVTGEEVFATEKQIQAEPQRFKPVPERAGGQSDSAVERTGSRLLELRNTKLQRELTPEEQNEEDILSFIVEGKRFSKLVDIEGNISVFGADGKSTPVLDKNGNQMVDIAQVKETRQKASAVSNNQKALTDTLNNVAGEDIDFVRQTKGINTDSGRESVDDTRLVFMFARTLPGVGKDIAQGDLERLSEIPGLPENIITGIKGLIAGKTLPEDVRASLKQRIIVDRSMRADFVRETISGLEKQAANTNTPDWTPPGMPKGSEFYPIKLDEGMTNEELRNTVQPGQWFIDVDGVLKQRPK